MDERSARHGPWSRPSGWFRSGWLWIVLALVCCTASGLAAYHFAYAVSARSQIAAASQSLRSVSAALGAVLGRHEALPRMLALDPRLSQALAAPTHAAIGEANAYLAEIARSGNLMAAFLIDGRGTALAASNWDRPGSFVGQNYAFRPYFQDALAHGTGRFYAVGATSGEPGYFLASSVQAADGSKGVVVVKVALDSTLRMSGDDAEEVVAVVDEFGVVFLCSDRSWLYRPVEPLSAKDLATLKATQRYGSRLSAAPLHADLLHSLQPVWHRIGDRGWQIVSFKHLRASRSAGWLGALAGVLAAALVMALVLFAWLRRARDVERERSREQLSQSKERLHAVVDNLPVMVCFVSSEQRYVFANALYAQQYGCNARELEGKGVWEVLDPEEYEATQPQMRRALAGETVVFEREYRSMRMYRCFEATYRPEWNHDRTAVTGVHVMTQDVTQTQQRLQDLARLSQLDHLTQLMNRKGFESRLASALSAEPVAGTYLALLFIDLDGFKPVNDTHGHAAGDAVLTAFGQRVARLVREDDVVARLGGDEFAVLLPAIANVGVAERVASAIVTLAQRPFAVEGGLTVHIGASVGVAWRPHDRTIGPQALCHSADAYLYDAKKGGRRTFVIGEALEHTRVDSAEPAATHLKERA
ncbi:diguanylate cyclase domain-containing protein [Piscinibacter sp. HJYY11]|uniref:diguanylate cyclase domain-containing protein n=1 Tax=Piscinibacter sp. HJYY11 TaxID=2801333 RepID=UPI00191DEA60|nr:diguanylate cyclase [Piscinibacter sp. HJYY11]MBL0726640.1 diguanylate cyclase [Piscinibacter sp. HJYY11]